MYKNLLPMLDLLNFYTLDEIDVEKENDLLLCILKNAPEFYYEMRELYERGISLNLAEAHPIYKDNLAKTDYVLTNSDYLEIVERILNNYADTQLIKRKLHKIPSNSIINYLILNQNVDIYIFISTLFDTNISLLEELYVNHKKIDKQPLSYLLGLIRINGSYTEDENTCVDEMMEYAGRGFYEKIKYVDEDPVTSPTHVLAGEVAVEKCSMQIKNALAENK